MATVSRNAGWMVGVLVYDESPCQSGVFLAGRLSTAGISIARLCSRGHTELFM